VSPWLSDLFLRSQTDERLVGLARAGHDRAFVAIVERYNRQLVGFARRLGPASRAEDVVQQAFLSAFTALQAGAEVQHLRGWLHQIVRNAAIKAAARAPSEWELSDDVIAADNPEEEVERRLFARSMLTEVARLPERQRDALLETVQGHSRSEVALSMGLSEGAVRQLVHRARTSLRTVVTAITPYPLVIWAAGARSAPGANRMAEMTLAAGSASAGGLALKAGAVVVATGMLATGIVVSHTRLQPSHRMHQVHAAGGLTGAGTQAKRASVVTSDITGSVFTWGRRRAASSSSRSAVAGGRARARFGDGSEKLGGGGDATGLGNADSGAASGSESSPTRGGSQAENSGVQKSSSSGTSGGDTSTVSSGGGHGGATTTTAVTDGTDTTPAAPSTTTSTGQETTAATSGG